MIRVLAPGPLTTVQDAGRAVRRLGVSGGGAADADALAAGNLLVGNAADAAALEWTLAGPTLRAEAPLVAALTGAPAPAELDGQPVRPWRPFRWPAGATLCLGRARRGLRGIVAVAGGIDAPVVLGGRGTDLRGSFGGLAGRALAAGDALPIGRAGAPPAAAAADARTFDASLRPAVLRVLPDAAWDGFGEELTVLPQSDRMGLRLAARATTALPALADSRPVLPGALQLPPDGQPILLLADAPVTGGYPVVGHVIATDLPRAAQAAPGEPLRLLPVDRAVAARAWAQRTRDLGRLAAALRLAPPLP